MHFRKIRSGPHHHLVQDRAQAISNNKIVPVLLITITARHNSHRAPRGDAKAQEQDIITIKTKLQLVLHLIHRDNANENEIATQIIEQ